jgi:hypothetical protein
MPRMLWVEHGTAKKTYIAWVPIEGCDFVSAFLTEIRKDPQLQIPNDSEMTLFQSDKTTPIDVGGSPADYLVGNSRNFPLVVKTIDNNALKCT